MIPLGYTTPDKFRGADYGTADELREWSTAAGRFLREKDFAPATQQPHLVRPVRGFLLFAETYRGYSVEQTRDLFLTHARAHIGVKPWQLRRRPAPLFPSLSVSAGPAKWLATWRLILQGKDQDQAGEGAVRWTGAAVE